VRIDQGFDIGIVFRSTFDAACGAEGRDQCIFPRQISGALEKFHILGVGPWPTALDEGNAKFIQLLCDTDLVIA
jgi:hypothetical protein